MVWSFSVADPTDPLGETALFHNHMGSLSVNLLSGITEPPAEPDDLRYFDVVVSNVRTYSLYSTRLAIDIATSFLDSNSMQLYVYVQVTIPPNDTTYWCETTQITEDVLTSTKYIIRVII